MKALIFMAVLIVPCAALSADRFDKYTIEVIADDVQEMKGDIKELNRKVAQIDKDALTKEDAEGLLQSINKLQQQIASIETKLTEVPITRISNLEQKDQAMEKDIDWMMWAVKGAIGGAATSLAGVFGPMLIRRRRNGNGNGNGHPEFCAPRGKS